MRENVRMNAKKIFVPILAAAMITAFGGCALNDMVDRIRGEIFENVKFEDDSSYTSVAPAESIDCQYYNSNKTIMFGYNSLVTDSQRECYNEINQSVYKVSEEVNESGLYPIGKVTIEDKTFSENDMNLCIKAYTMDHPEVFWITNCYTYGTGGDQAVIQLYSYLSGEQCKASIDELNSAIENIVTSIPSGLNEYHLEKYIHNTVLDNCVYASGVNSAEDGWEEFTVYGALVKGSAVCEGYAHAMCLLLNKVGIECYYINGYGESEPHMWNSVKVDGNWYHLDATWNDNENTYFNYFNLTDDQIKQDHIISPMFSELMDTDTLPDAYNVYLPECSSDSANYFVVESTYIYDFDECADTMVYDLVQAAKNGDEEFTVRFDSAMNFNDAMDEMFNKEPYYMFDYINQANKQLDSGSKLNEENLSIIILENFNSVVVKLGYV